MLRQAQYSSPGESGRRGFEDLECFKLALDLVVNAHEFARRLPADEKYDLVQQVRRSSKSVTANIAEGYGRYHYLDSLKFYSNARGSLNETLSHFIQGRVLAYIDQAYFAQLYCLARQAEKALNGYMSYVRKQRAGRDLYSDRAVREEPAEYQLDTDTDTGSASPEESESPE
ncbi:MAG TPA: four helix bundle protein [Anaerolineae bacterium]|nr:four helix bundle protein [Anaerolineae bacterium]